MGTHLAPFVTAFLIVKGSYLILLCFAALNNRATAPAAVGVAYKVLTALYEKMEVPYDHIETQSLVALGTICDLVPLVGENRDLVRLGLEAIRSTNRPGLIALANESNLDLSEITAETLGWNFGPKINAAGRMKHGEIALQLLLTKNKIEAQTLANVYQALDNNHEIIPVLNKIDLPASDIEKTNKQIEDVIGMESQKSMEISAKNGEGIMEDHEAHTEFGYCLGSNTKKIT